MSVADFALRNARGIFATLAVLVVLGIVSVGQLPQTIYPTVAFARVVVVAENGETAPEQVQRNITRPIEEAVSTVAGATLVQANSAQGASEVSITFDPHSEINIDLQRVTSALAQVQPSLPPGTTASAQIVYPNVFPVLGYTIDIPGKTPTDIRTFSEYDLKPVLTGIAGVAGIRVMRSARAISSHPSATSTPTNSARSCS